VVLYLLLPKNVVVPDVVGAASAFDAEKTLTDKGLKLAPEQKQKTTKDADPGTVIGQVPAAGKKAEKGSAVSLLIAVGSGEATVPNIVGRTAAEAEQVLRKRKLTLGQASPQPLDPAKKISSQIPAANQVVKQGTPVDIFFPEPGKDGGGGDNGGGASNGGGGGGGGGDVVIPAIDGASSQEFAQTLSDKKLVPEAKTVFDASKPGTLFATDPAAGETVKEGTKVTLLVSAGFPAVVYDDDKDILRANGASGKPLSPVSKGPGLEKDPTVSPDGDRVAFTRDGRIFLADLTKPGSSPAPLTSGDDRYADLAWAPTTDADVLAMDRVGDDDTDLCFGTIEGGSMTPQCLPEPDVRIGSAIHWATNGRAVFATGGKNPNTGQFGVMRWRTSRPFSADPGDWGAGQFVTNIDKPNEGVREAVLSPDGKVLAAIARRGDRPFELFLTTPGNFALTNAKSTGVSACKVAWQPDSRGLVIVQADDVCERQAIGTLARVPVDDPQQTTDLKVDGDNPAFQPLPGG
jgi:beta-lactam-binding protein with PASTA domain